MRTLPLQGHEPQARGQCMSPGLAVTPHLGLPGAGYKGGKQAGSGKFLTFGRRCDSAPCKQKERNTLKPPSAAASSLSQCPPAGNSHHPAAAKVLNLGAFHGSPTLTLGTLKPQSSPPPTKNPKLKTTPNPIEPNCLLRSLTHPYTSHPSFAHPWASPPAPGYRMVRPSPPAPLL